MCRCGWCLMNEKMTRYHDEEWGVPLRDDKKQFEFLMMEAMQCGLNWNMMIQKREIFRKCFDGFDYDIIADYGEADLARIMAAPGMIRSPRKINAVITNARRFREIRAEFGSFCDYLWAYTGGRTVRYTGREAGFVPTKNALSDSVAADLKKRGFKYLGSVTLYSHLQACGVIDDHEEFCFRRAYITENFPVKYEEWR